MKYLKIDNDYIKLNDMNNFYKKLKGLMFKKEKINEGYLFYKTNSIHMFFMFQSIDVVMTDKNYKVIYKTTIKPWKVILPHKNVYYTFELPLGVSERIILNEFLTLTEK